MPASDYKPTTADVAARIRARTRTPGGGEVGTFNDETIPTAAEVQPLIDLALADVAALIGTEIPEGDDEDANPRLAAKNLVSLWAAMQIEMSFWPEQVSSGSSQYATLKEQYDQMLPAVKAMIDDLRAASGDASDDMGEAASLPVSSFRRNAGGLVGWQTRF